MARKARKKKAGRKGRRGASRKAAKKTKRKSSKRSAAARKAARTRKANAAARSASARKAARSRKRKGGKRAAGASESKKTKKKAKKAKKKGGGKKGKRRAKRQDLASQLTSIKGKLATVEQRYADRHKALQDKILRAADNEKSKLREKLIKLEAERGKELARIKNSYALKSARLEAAEKKRRKGGKGKRRGARRNPIGSGGAHEWGATALGILTGLLLTVGPYRMIRSHALTPAGAGQGGSGGIDAPAQGDVPNLLTGSLPLWSRLKWRGLIAIVTVGAVDIALPAVLAAYSDSDFWKTFNQTWMVTGVTLAGAKVVTDVGALALKSTLIGQRMFAAENTARDVRAMSAAAQLPSISVAPGLGLPGLTGYGKPAVGAAGCGCGTCDKCKDGKVVTPPPAGQQPIPQPVLGTTPLPNIPQQQTPLAGGMNPGSPLQGIVSSPRNNVGNGAPPPSNVSKFERPSRFERPNRFDKQRLK